MVKNLFSGRLRAPLLEPAVTVSMAVTALVPVTSTEVGIEQVTCAELEEVQARLTVPVNPLDGVTEMVEVPDAPCVTVIAPLLERE